MAKIPLLEMCHPRKALALLAPTAGPGCAIYHKCKSKPSKYKSIYMYKSTFY
jgi:hypothetical protein